MAVRQSVPRVSRLDYVMTIIAKLGKKDEVTFEELFSAVRETGFKIEKQRLKLTGIMKDLLKEDREQSYDRHLRSQTKEVIRLLKRWNLLQQSSKEAFRMLRTPQGLLDEVILAREKGLSERDGLLNVALKSSERFLYPSAFSFVLRNGEAGGISGAMYKEAFRKELGSMTIGKSVNPISIDVVTDWMKFFRFCDVFDAVDEEKKPADLVISTKAVSKIEELRDFVSFIRKSSPVSKDELINEYQASVRQNAFTVSSIYECAKQLSLINESQDITLGEDFSLDGIIKNARQVGALVIVEDKEQSEIIDNIVPDDTRPLFVCVDFKIDVQQFFEVLYKQTKRAMDSQHGYAWTHDVRREVCKITHVHSSTFDDYLVYFYRKFGPGLIETSSVSWDTLAAKRIKAIPLVVDDKPIYRFRLRRDHL